ncbi:hypothetical protein HMSP1_40 [Sinorhizobium phage HMSP1-Susan]|nr:hypothetical protein HMSP1_40 [Sinorhizobium phage HMSP1-Susan]
MSFIQILEMYHKLPKAKDSNRLMTDDEYEASKDAWRALNLPDVRV